MPHTGFSANRAMLVTSPAHEIERVFAAVPGLVGQSNAASSKSAWLSRRKIQCPGTHAITVWTADRLSETVRTGISLPPSNASIPPRALAILKVALRIRFWGESQQVPLICRILVRDLFVGTNNCGRRREIPPCDLCCVFCWWPWRRPLLSLRKEP